MTATNRNARISAPTASAWAKLLILAGITAFASGCGGGGGGGGSALPNPLGPTSVPVPPTTVATQPVSIASPTTPVAPPTPVASEPAIASPTVAPPAPPPPSPPTPTPTPTPIPAPTPAPTPTSPPAPTPAPVPANPPVLHAILVGITNDFSIGDATGVDLGNMHDELSGIAEATGMTLDETRLSGDDATNVRLSAAIAALQVASDDAVVFYYSGHGARFSSTSTRAPTIRLEDRTIDSAIIMDSVEGKRGRLCISFVDACNVQAGSRNGVSASKVMRKRAANDNLRRLFLGNAGRIRVAAAQPGEYALCSDNVGSYGTGQFIRALEDAADGSVEPSWKAVLDAACKPIVFDSGRTQTPIAESEVSETKAASVRKPAPQPAPRMTP